MGVGVGCVGGGTGRLVGTDGLLFFFFFFFFKQKQKTPMWIKKKFTSGAHVTLPPSGSYGHAHIDCPCVFVGNVVYLFLFSLFMGLFVWGFFVCFLFSFLFYYFILVLGWGGGGGVNLCCWRCYFVLLFVFFVCGEGMFLLRVLLSTCCS